MTMGAFSCTLILALPLAQVNQLFSVAPGTGPVFFRNLQLDSGVVSGPISHLAMDTLLPSVVLSKRGLCHI